MVMVSVHQKAQLLAQSRRCRQTQSLSLYKTTYIVTNKLHSCRLILQNTKY